MMLTLACRELRPQEKIFLQFLKAKIIFKFVKLLAGCTAGWWFGISAALVCSTLMVWLSMASASSVFSWENVYLKWLDTKQGLEYLNKEMHIQLFFKKAKQNPKRLNQAPSACPVY